MHAAALIRRAADLLPQCTFYGLAGPRMRQAGAQSLLDLTQHAAMLTGIARLAGRGWRAIRMAKRSWRADRPDLAILMDSGTLHLPMARRARKLGIPVLYYIAPQTWASRAYRNRTLRNCVDRVACILPFEQEYFRSVGVRATFVGHPLFEAIRGEKPDAQRVDWLRRGEGPLVALLPGSREQVIRSLLPIQLRVVQHLRQRGVRVRVAVSSTSTERTRQIDALLRKHHEDVPIVEQDLPTLLTACDLALVASGTATLHAAAYQSPMIVMYDAGRALRLPYRVAGRAVIRTPHLSLVNILAGRRIVPEFMPFVPDAEPVACVAHELLRDETWRRQMQVDVSSIAASLAGPEASVRVCELIREMV
jgi:lipid-A-disaccharide synthase